jgi:2-methylcitrate dehydratase PrpD
MAPRQRVTAYLYSLDAMTSLAGAMNPSHYAAGWHPTATVGAIGAALAAGKLAGLDAEQTSSALAIAANQASGMRSVFGSMGKALNAGNAARVGVLAAALAGRGFTGGVGVLDGMGGFRALHAGSSAGPDDLSHPLDHSFTRAIGGLSLKRFPACGVMQAPIEAALSVAAQRRLTVSDIASVDCVVEPFIRRILIEARPDSGSAARFSAQHCVAVALLDATVGLAQFTDERAAAGDVHALFERINIVDAYSDDRSPDMRWPCALTVTCSDGRRLNAIVDQPQGRGFGELLAERELGAKFADCLSWGGIDPEDISRCGSLLAELETLTELGELMNLLAGRARP